MTNEYTKKLVDLVIQWPVIVFVTTLLKFVNSVALKPQFTSKWTESDIVKENFPITYTQCVMGDCNSPEQSI